MATHPGIGLRHRFGREALKWPGLPVFWSALITVVVLVAAAAFKSAIKPLWYDELLTAFVIDTPSPTAVVRGLADAIDTTPPLYYLVAWTWAQVFGSSDLALRVLSGLLFATGFLVLVRLVRAAFGDTVATVVPASCLLLSQTMAFQVAEARCYGLLFTLCACGAWLFWVAINRERLGAGFLIANAAMQAGLLYCHLYGAAYGAFFLLAAAIFRLFGGRVPVSYFVSALAGWLVFLPWIPAFLTQVAATDGVFWIARPGLSDLVRWSDGSVVLPFALLVILAALFCRPRETIPAREEATPTWSKPRLGLLILGTLMVGVIFAAWLFSVCFRPLIHERYLLPSSIGWMLLLSVMAWSLQRTRDRQPGAPGRRALVFLVPVWAGFMFLAWRTEAPLPCVLEETRLPTGNEIVVFEDPRVFAHARRYFSRPERFLLALDRDTSAAARQSDGITQFHLFSALGRQRFLSAIHVGQSLPEHLGECVFVNAENFDWFENHVRNAPDLTVVPGAEKSGFRLYRVVRSDPAPDLPAPK